MVVFFDRMDLDGGSVGEKEMVGYRVFGREIIVCVVLNVLLVVVIIFILVVDWLMDLIMLVRWMDLEGSWVVRYLEIVCMFLLVWRYWLLLGLLEMRLRILVLFLK